ncbi:MAG TPA: hypothetical protein VN441_06590 [Syntrophomonas sp.]|nr:hypothetical protein [Syntrophomonas sp.]
MSFAPPCFLIVWRRGMLYLRLSLDYNYNRFVEDLLRLQSIFKKIPASYYRRAVGHGTRWQRGTRSSSLIKARRNLGTVLDLFPHPAEHWRKDEFPLFRKKMEQETVPSALPLLYL